MHRIICLKLCRFALECICKQRELLISQAIVSQFTKAKSFVRKKRRRIHPTNFTKKGYSFTLSLSTPFCFGESAKMEFLVERREEKKKGVSSFISLFHQAKGKSGSSTLLKKRKCPHFSLIKKD